MKKAKKLLAALFGVVMLVSCMTISVFAAETVTQDGLNAVIQTDKESYAANEDIQITVTVTNTNTFEVKNVSIESLLPDALTLKDGDLKSKTVDLQPGETLSISCVAVLEKESTSVIDPTTTEPVTEAPSTTDPITTEPSTVETTEPESSTEPESTTVEETTGEPATTPATTDEPTTAEPTTIPATTMPTTETPATTEQTETTTDGGAILPVEPSTIEPTTVESTSAISTQSDTPDNPDTGSGSTIVKALLITVIAAAVVVAIVVITKKNNKKATKVISLVLCGAIVISSFATIGFIKVGAEENNTRNFTVNKTITVDGEDYTFSANVYYDIPQGTIKLYSDPKELNTSDAPQDVLFYIDTENTVDDCRVTLVDADGDKKVADMQDDGKDGDETAGDGIYSTMVPIDCTEEKTLQYYAVIDGGNVSFMSKVCEINIFAPMTDEEAEKMETVDERLSGLTGSSEYQNMDEHSRKEAIETLLYELANEGLVIKKSIYYDDINKMYSFSYGCMIQGAVVLYPPKNSSDEPDTWSDSTSVTTVCSEIKNKLQVLETNRRNLGECTIYYGAGIDDISNYNFYNRLQKTLNNRGLSTVMDVDVTVSDLKNIDGDNEVCIIASHGSYFTYTYRTGFLWLDKVTLENPMICLNEITSKDKDKEYQADIKSKRILKITSSGETYYWIYPELLESAYSSNDLEGMILAATCCEFMGKDKIVDTSMANAFTNSGVETVLGFYNSVYCDYANSVIETFVQELINGRTAIQSYNQALKQWGADDVIWYESAGYTGTPHTPAKPILYGDNQDIILNIYAGTITGTVKDEVTKAPISGVKVYVEENGVVTSSCYTNENGGFELALPVGHHILHYSHDNYEHAMNGFDIEKDATTVIMEPVYLTPKNTETPVEPSIPDTAVEFNGHYYQVYDTPMTWDEAKAYCESLGGHLATITSAEENNFIKDLVSSGTKNVYWLGASDAEQEGVWKWVTSEPFEFTNWSYGEPNDDGEISTPEDYLEMYKSSGKWNDGEIDGDPNGYGGKCSLANHGLICEWDTDVKPTGTCITQMEIVDHGQYTGNQGDSRVFHLDKSGLAGNDNRYYGNGNIGLDGTEYNNGLEVWIARWNFREEISWAYATYKLDGKYTRLTGKTSLIKSANTDNFDTTIYFYNGDTLLQSYTLTNEDYEKQIDVDVSGVNELKILVQDNKAVKRGTSFALYDMFLK